MKRSALFLITFITVQLHAQNGSFLWAKQMGGTSSNASGNAITIDKLGNVYTSGGFSGTVDFDPGPGVYNLTSVGVSNIFISKLDSTGNFLWAKQMGKTGNAASSAMTIDLLGNIYITGFFDDTVDFDPGPATYDLTSFGGDGDIFVSKLNEDGGFEWTKQMGGIYGDQGLAITVDKDGFVYTTGEAEGDVDFDPGPGVYTLTSWGQYISKLDPAGNFVWAKIMSATGFSTGRSIVLDKNGNIYTSGWFGGTVDFDPGPGQFIMDGSGVSNFVSKFNKSGDFVWAKQMGGSFLWESSSMTMDLSGNLILTGTFESTEDFDPGPGVSNLVPAGGIDVFVSKFDLNGNCLWAKQIGGAGWETGNSITTDAKGNSYLTGFFGGSADFDPGPGINILTSIDVRDIFVSALDANGKFLWAKQMGGPGPRPVTNSFPITGNSISVDPLGNIYTTGSFNYTVDFNPDPGVFNLTSYGVTDIFVHKMNPCKFPTYGAITVSTCDSFSINGKTYTASGMYTQTVNNSIGCDSIITIQLTINHKSISAVTKKICLGQNYAGHTESGNYVDTLIAANGCDSLSTLTLEVVSAPRPDLGVDKGLCPGDSLVLYPGQFDNYQWQDASVQSRFTVKKPGVYSVTVKDACGTGSDDILVKESTCDVVFPSAFTPNNDGKNDVFKLLGGTDLTEFNLSVYDRWGQKVFSTDNLRNGWDGKFNGRLQEPAVYVWYCTFKRNNRTTIMKGTVLLIR